MLNIFFYINLMREKLKELSEILKQNTAIKERLERLEFGCWMRSKQYWIYYILYDKYNDMDDIIIGREPQYSDILEYLGSPYMIDCYSIQWPNAEKIIPLSPWPLSEQLDETLDEIISLCKNVWKE